MQNFIPEKPISKLPLLNFLEKFQTKKKSNEQFNIFNAKMTPGDNLTPQGSALEQESYPLYIRKITKRTLQTTDTFHF